MKKIALLYYFLSFVGIISLYAQSPTDCSPVKEGKIRYSDEVQVEGITKDNLYRVISAWAKKNYGKDFFVSCEATLFHAQNLFNEVYDAVKAGK